MLLFLSSCITFPSLPPDAKYIDTDYKKPKKIAVLPMNNQTVDTEAPPIFRELLFRYLNRTDYAIISPNNKVDSLLNEEGITDAGQLPAIQNEELFKIFNVDGIIYNDLLDCEIFAVPPFSNPRIKANLKLVTPPSKMQWESELLETASLGGLFSGLWTRAAYTLSGVEDHPLMSQMDDIIINSLKSIPDYIDRQFPAVIYGFEIGYLPLQGSWYKHRYAPNVNQFNGGPEFAVNIEMKGGFFGFGLKGGYGIWGLGEWEKYANSKGDKIKASASCWHIDTMIKLYPYVQKWNIVKLELGINYFQANGKESYDGRTYEYDFLKWGIGMFFGIEYNHFLDKHIALSLQARYMNIADAIEYADGRIYNIVIIPITSGIRLYY
jgi:hypothetical protein